MTPVHSIPAYVRPEFGTIRESYPWWCEWNAVVSADENKALCKYWTECVQTSNNNTGIKSLNWFVGNVVAGMRDSDTELGVLIDDYRQVVFNMVRNIVHVVIEQVGVGCAQDQVSDVFILVKGMLVMHEQLLGWKARWYSVLGKSIMQALKLCNSDAWFPIVERAALKKYSMALRLIMEDVRYQKNGGSSDGMHMLWTPTSRRADRRRLSGLNIIR